MIYLISATPGSGKTLWAVKMAFERANEDWNIFTNIDGLRLDSAKPLLNSFDDYPPKSLVIIDEAQRISHFSKKYKHPVKNENHYEVEFLQTHRHAEFLDIVFITQAPRLLNADVLDMVGTHIHLHRPMGMKLATWWMWKHQQLNPNTKSVKLEAEDTGTFTYPKHLFSMYKSSAGGGDTHSKIKIPMRLVQAIWMCFVILGLLIYSFNKASSDADPEPTLTEKLEKAGTPEQAISTKVEGLDERTEQERRQAFEEEMRRVSYNINKPYEFDESQYQYQVTSVPTLSGCVIFDNKCSCFTQQATRVNMSDKDCKKYMSGDKPFNPFERVQNNANQFNSTASAASSL